MRRLIAIAGLFTALGCGGDESRPDTQDAPEPTTDAQVPTTPDGATDPSRKIPLVDWVDDLLDRHTDDVSAPDTVHDKNIADDENPATFTARFGK